MAIKQLEHRFVDAFPETIDEGVLYIAMEFATMSHRCACGCGHEVVTPLSPRDWKMSYDGEAVTLSPSVGNWSLPCKSHYLIRNGRVVWAERWDDEKILAGRERDLKAKRGGDPSNPTPRGDAPKEHAQEPTEAPPTNTVVDGVKKPASMFRRLFSWLD
ncbi:DUF6527 family protein [Rhizobium sp. GCM10022189]|uniref:DUF6527 family protein n=1 Tax=Rhizobium sp. GCM10022189 TaxID=3252654 RepID=UPI003606EE6F